MDNLSSGNVRQALDFLSTFAGSGYVSVDRILSVYRGGGRYTLPLHEFMRSLLYGEYSHYDPRASAITNLFDITTSDGREHFLLPELLAVAQSHGESLPDGFVDVGVIFEHLQSLSYSLEQITSQVDRALDRKLIQASVAGSGSRSFRVTAAGGYVHKRMITVFSYMDAIVVDTPIVDPAVRGQIYDVKTVEDRLERAELFRQYLGNQWSLPDGVSAFSWPSASESLRLDMEATRARANRNRGRDA